MAKSMKTSWEFILAGIFGVIAFLAFIAWYSALPEPRAPDKDFVLWGLKYFGWIYMIGVPLGFGWIGKFIGKKIDKYS